MVEGIKQSSSGTLLADGRAVLFEDLGHAQRLLANEAEETLRMELLAQHTETLHPNLLVALSAEVQTSAVGLTIFLETGVYEGLLALHTDETALVPLAAQSCDPGLPGEDSLSASGASHRGSERSGLFLLLVGTMASFAKQIGAIIGLVVAVLKRRTAFAAPDALRVPVSLQQDDVGAFDDFPAAVAGFGSALSQGALFLLQADDAVVAVGSTIPLDKLGPERF